MKDILKSIGSLILGLCIISGVTMLVIMFLKGGVWLSVRAYPWLLLIATLTFLVTVLVFLPLAIFRKTRGLAGLCTFYASYVFGLLLWVYGLLMTYTLWGIGAVVVGLIIMGVGVVPMSMLACLFNGSWSTFGELVLLTVITFGSRVLGLYFSGKAENDGY